MGRPSIVTRPGRPPTPGARAGSGQPDRANGEIVQRGRAIGGKIAPHDRDVGGVGVGRAPIECRQPTFAMGKAPLIPRAPGMAGVTAAYEIRKDAPPGREVVITQFELGGAQVAAAQRLAFA